MTIRVERERDAEAWDAYAAQFAAAGPFHARGWAEGFADARTTPLYLRLLDGEQPVGAIAGVAIDRAWRHCAASRASCSSSPGRRWRGWTPT